MGKKGREFDFALFLDIIKYSIEGDKNVTRFNLQFVLL